MLIEDLKTTFIILKQWVVLVVFGTLSKAIEVLLMVLRNGYTETHIHYTNLVEKKLKD